MRLINSIVILLASIFFVAPATALHLGPYSLTFDAVMPLNNGVVEELIDVTVFIDGETISAKSPSPYSIEWQYLGGTISVDDPYVYFSGIGGDFHIIGATNAAWDLSSGAFSYSSCEICLGNPTLNSVDIIFSGWQSVDVHNEGEGYALIPTEIEINAILGSATPLQISTVPIPAAAWLFGSALLGLIGIKRKQR